VPPLVVRAESTTEGRHIVTDSPTIYEALAQRLSNTPNGLPRSENGTELKLLAKMFAPEEARLGAVMHLALEDAAEIGARVGLEEKVALASLKGMARKGLVRAGRGKKGLAFALLPFVVGSYEEALPYLDEEMARLFERLIKETRGEGLLGPGPALQRIIPVEQSIDADIELLPYERASELLESAKSFGVRECICRKQKGMIGERCDYPLENCLNFAPVEGAFANQPHVRPITREEALQILREAEEAGLVHSVYNQQEGIFYICNCCPCCCGIMRGVVEFGHAHALARSNYQAAVDTSACTGCESCLERCHFEALSVPDDVCVVDIARCMGCGLCVSACPTDAIRLVKRASADQLRIPGSYREWQEERAAARGMALDELL
jgi:electron transport complex protein RnfB